MGTRGASAVAPLRSRPGHGSSATASVCTDEAWPEFVRPLRAEPAAMKPCFLFFDVAAFVSPLRWSLKMEWKKARRMATSAKLKEEGAEFVVEIVMPGRDTPQDWPYKVRGCAAHPLSGQRAP